MLQGWRGGRHQLALSVSLNVILLVVLLTAGLLRLGILEDMTWRLGAATQEEFTPSAWYESVRARWSLSRLDDHDLVLIGDSHVDAPDWDELLGRDAANRGIGGDTTLGVLHRLSDIRDTGARVAVVLVGYNDLASHRQVEEVAATYEQIVSGLLEDEGIEDVVVVSTIHTGVGHERHGVLQEAVRTLNDALAALAAEQRSAHFIDLNATVAPDGALLPPYNLDEVHLTADGYAAMVQALDPLLIELLGPRR